MSGGHPKDLHDYTVHLIASGVLVRSERAKRVALKTY